MTFRVGEKVRVCELSEHDLEYYSLPRVISGDVGTIRQAFPMDDDGFEYVVYGFNNTGYEWYVPGHVLRHVRRECIFKNDSIS